MNIENLTIQQKSLAVAVLRLGPESDAQTVAGGPSTTARLAKEPIHYRTYALTIKTRKLGYDATNSGLRRLAERGIVEAVAPAKGQRGRGWKITDEARREVLNWTAYFSRVSVG